MPKTAPRITSDTLRSKIKVRSAQASLDLAKKHPHVEKFLLERQLDLGKIREHSAKILGAGALTGTLVLSPPGGLAALPPPHEIVEKLTTTSEGVSKAPKEILIGALAELLPTKIRALSPEEEKYLSQLFESIMGVKAKANLEGEHLNTTYGLIGAEQHLKRYPGDTVSSHGEGVMLKEGIAPGLGAWGYFSPTKNKLSADLEETEKWYVVVQTLYLPDWNTRFRYLRDWYKYRKVLVVNTENGNAIVGAIADSGPAAWTGKHFGGSPEVMYELGGPRYKKGPVLIFFVDDPENKIPLGPVDYNQINLPVAYQVKT